MKKKVLAAYKRSELLKKYAGSRKYASFCMNSGTRMCASFCSKSGTHVDSGTRIFSGRYPQKPETRTIDTRTYPKPDFYARNPSLSVSDL